MDQTSFGSQLRGHQGDQHAVTRHCVALRVLGCYASGASCGPSQLLPCVAIERQSFLAATARLTLQFVILLLANGAEHCCKQ